jgi:hypothetical protein
MAYIIEENILEIYLISESEIRCTEVLRNNLYRFVFDSQVIAFTLDYN